MLRTQVTTRLIALLALLTTATSAHAVTLRVNCNQNAGLTGIGAALRLLQNGESHGPATILVSGHCHENVVIQSIDRLTLNAVNGASITDVSRGALDVVIVLDSRDVTITGFSINGGANGIDCLDGTLCRTTPSRAQRTA
jgi:hypothetical protein